MGKYEEAIADATRALELDPNSAFAYQTRAEAYRMLGKYEEAIADATRALEVDPNSAFAYRTRAEA